MCKKCKSRTWNGKSLRCWGLYHTKWQLFIYDLNLFFTLQLRKNSRNMVREMRPLIGILNYSSDFSLLTSRQTFPNVRTINQDQSFCHRHSKNQSDAFCIHLCIEPRIPGIPSCKVGPYITCWRVGLRKHSPGSHVLLWGRAGRKWVDHIHSLYLRSVFTIPLHLEHHDSVREQ